MSNHRISAEFLLAGLAICLSLVIPVTLQAQGSSRDQRNSGGQGIKFNLDPNEVRTETESEEIVINFRVGRVIDKDLVVLYKNQTVLLPLLEVFGLLDLNVQVDFGSQRFSGYLLTKEEPFEIDVGNLTAQVRGQQHQLFANDLALKPGELYLGLNLYRELFDLDMQFNFSALIVNMPLNEEMPFYQKILRRQARERLESRAVARRDYRSQPRPQPYLAGGVADWVVAGTPVGEGGQYYNLALGGMLFGGDLQLSGGGNSVDGFDAQQASYRWHYYFGDGPSLTQVDVGDIYTPGFLSRRLKGARVTNRQQIARRHFQTVNMSEYVGEGWEIELYVNSKLVDYVLTDAGGRYDFSVDIEYGATDIVLKMFGPDGELKTEHRYVDVPYSILPKGIIEYAVTAGVNDAFGQPNQTFGQTVLSYGLTERLTTNLSTDVPISSGSGESALFEGGITAKVSDNLTTNASLTPNYAASLSLNFSQPSFLYADANYTKYFENEIRNPIKQIHRLRTSLSFPLRIRKQYLSLRWAITWDKLSTFDLINMNYGTNVRLGRVNLNYLGRTTLKKYSSKSSARTISELFITPNYLRWFKPQFNLVFDHSVNELTRYGVQWTQRLFRRAQFNLSLSHAPLTGSNQIMMTFRLLSGFADFTTRLVRSGGVNSISQLQRGSVRYDQTGHSLIFDRRNGVGAASAVVRPFLDDNYNGVRDDGEEPVPGLKARINGGRSSLLGGGQLYSYSGLQAYNGYVVEIDETSLDNPWMKPVHKYYEIMFNPNVVTAIELPVVMVSEAGGRITRQVDSLTAGVGGIIIILMNLDRETVTELTSFSSGDYFYLGFIPGSYRAYIDPRQLENLGLRSEPASIEFVIKPIQGGTVIENIDFLLIPNP